MDFFAELRFKTSGRGRKIIKALTLLVLTGILVTWQVQRRLLAANHGASDPPGPLTAGQDLLKVPNQVHFFHFDSRDDLTFASATCILAAFLNQRPDNVFIHGNVNFDDLSGKRWRLVREVLGSRLTFRDVKKPTHVFGQPISSVFHAVDIVRIKVLLEQGGIALDQDTFLIKNLTEFFDQELTIGWPEGQSIGTQVLVAKAGARFLRLWLESYKDYRPSLWYYNAAELPTQAILSRRPDLVTRVKEGFGVDNLATQLYSTVSWPAWKDHFAIHLLIRHRDYLAKEDFQHFPDIDETNIEIYPKTFGEMARSVWNHPEVLLAART